MTKLESERQLKKLKSNSLYPRELLLDECKCWTKTRDGTAMLKIVGPGAHCVTG